MPCSGRNSRGSVSYCGPPTAPISDGVRVLRESQRRRRQRMPGSRHKPAPPIGAVSVAIGSPSARSTSRTRCGFRHDFGADAVTRQDCDLHAFSRVHKQKAAPLYPGAASRRESFRSRDCSAQPFRLERANRLGVLQRQADLVQSVQQAMLAKRLDVEREHQRAVGRRTRSAVPGRCVSWNPGKANVSAKSRSTCGLRQHDRQQPVLVAVVEEDVRDTTAR